MMIQGRQARSQDVDANCSEVSGMIHTLSTCPERHSTDQTRAQTRRGLNLFTAYIPSKSKLDSFGPGQTAVVMAKTTDAGDTTARSTIANNTLTQTIPKFPKAIPHFKTVQNNPMSPSRAAACKRRNRNLVVSYASRFQTIFPPQVSLRL